MINKINAKAKIHGGGGGWVSNKPTFKRSGLLETIHKANIVIGSYNDGVVRILKDRYKGNPTSLHEKASIDDVIDRTSSIICHAVFGKNELIMFQEGLKGEIENAIKNTIATFHEKRR